MTKHNTSWGKVAEWYDAHLADDDSYHAQVVIPNTLRILAPKKDDHILDVACGQGIFVREVAKTGAHIAGADIAPELINLAKEHSPSIPFYTAPADKLIFAKDHSYDAATIMLAIQNMADIGKVFAEMRRVLAHDGRLILVMNHPAFRVPQASSWVWDDEKHTQYRRVDGYLTPRTAHIVAHPGKKNSEVTLSYHRPLQDFVKALAKHGFAITRLEEWISHRTSEAGPRAQAEDTARKEFPLFLMIEAK